MNIKRKVLALTIVGVMSVSAYSSASVYVFKSPLNGVKASTNIGDDVNNVEDSDESDTQESNLTEPTALSYTATGNQLAGNIGDIGNVAISDNLGNIIGQTTSNTNGDFIVSLDPPVVTNDVLSSVVTDNIETINTTLIVPENIGTVVACYDAESIGKVGNQEPCDNMLIIDNTLLAQATADNSYAITVDGISYTFANSEHNIFTGQVTSMNALFMDKDYNEDIGYWNTSNVTDMYRMFNFSTFNQDISKWDTSNVINMYGMFGQSDFNQDIGSWETYNVTNMNSMFRDTPFNQDISKWNISNVNTIRYMFGYTPFNQDISSWDTSNVLDMSNTFTGAIDFNQDLSSWCVSNFESKPYAFDLNASSWSLKRPVFGTCPRGENN